MSAVGEVFEIPGCVGWKRPCKRLLRFEGDIVICQKRFDEGLDLIFGRRGVGKRIEERSILLDSANEHGFRSIRHDALEFFAKAVKPDLAVVGCLYELLCSQTQCLKGEFRSLRSLNAFLDVLQCIWGKRQ